jgi:hypothetical protein
MKKKEIIYLYNILLETLKIAEKLNACIKFKFGIIRSRDFVKQDFDQLKEIEEDNAKPLKAFYEERNKLITKYGETEGQNVVVRPKIIVDKKEADNPKWKKYEKELEPIKDKYKKELDEYEKKMKEYSETVLEEDCELPKVHKISISNVPEDFPTELLDILIHYEIITE